MQAAFYTQQGPAADVLHIGGRPDPTPGPGEILVRVAVSAVNPSDVKARDGFRSMDFPLVIPHSDAAGEVVGVGDGVDRARLRQRVWLREAQWRRPFGAAAELVALPEDLASPLPDGAPVEAGACLGIPALTAHRCLLADGPIDEAVVLVRGAAGRVGRYAAQIANLCGATVVATAGRDADLEDLRGLGISHVVDHRRDDVAALVRDVSDGRGADRVVEVDFGANLTDTLRAVGDNGVVSAYASMSRPRPELPFYDLMMRNITVRTVLVYEMPAAAKSAAVADITGWLRDGALDHRLGPSFALDEVVAAHQAVEAGARGVVTVQS